jgi:ribosome assembly protein 1
VPDLECTSTAAADSAEHRTFVGFARVLCGVLRPDTPLFVIGPKYVPKHVPAGTATAPGPADTELPSGRQLELAAPHLAHAPARLPVYMMMGRELATLPCAPAGMVVAIGGLAEHIVKTATLATTPACPSLNSLRYQVGAPAGH